MKNLCFILLAFVGGTLIGHSQGQFLSDGQDGFGVQIEYAANKSVSSLNGLFGYSIKGRFDIQASAGQAWFEQQINGYGVTAFQFSPAVNAYPFKQDQADIPVTVGVSASYQLANYSSDGLDRGNQTEKQHGFIFSAAVLRNADLAEDAYAQPFIGVAYALATVDFTNSAGQSLSASENKPIFSIGASFVFKDAPSDQFIFRPELDFDKDDTTIGVGVMLIL